MPLRAARQRLVRRNPATTWPLYLLAAMCFTWLVVLALQGDLQDEAVATVFATSLVLIVVRYRDADRMPLLGSTSGPAVARVNLEAAGPYRQVTIYNEGPGPGIVTALRWRVVGNGVEEHIESRAALRDTLDKKFQLVEGRDYDMDNVTVGAPLGTTFSRTYFVSTEAALEKFSVFDAIFELESLHGDVYERTVRLLPHSGASVQAQNV